MPFVSMAEHATILPPPPSRALALRAALTARYAHMRAEAARFWGAAAAAVRSFARGDPGEEPSEGEVTNGDYVTVRLSSLGTQRPVRFMDDAVREKTEDDERATVVDKPKRAG
jgi:hypothetical protein